MWKVGSCFGDDAILIHGLTSSFSVEGIYFILLTPGASGRLLNMEKLQKA